MKKMRMLAIALAVMMMSAVPTAALAQDVQQLEKDIEQHEKNMQTQRSRNTSRLVFWIALLVLALALYLFLR